MDQSNEQLNINLDEGVATKRKSRLVWDIILWVVIIVLALAVFLRGFVLSKVTISGDSMTAAYYGSETSPHYEPAMTYHDKGSVTVNKLAKPKRGEVVVFYKTPVKSKFLAMFAHGDSTKEGGEYYKLIKRVVALGGDKLWLESLDEGKFRLVIMTPQGELIHEDYYKKNGKTLAEDCFILSTADQGGLGSLAGTSEQSPIVVQEGYIFVLGDNRADSADSRGELGQVSLSQLFGVVI